MRKFSSLYRVAYADTDKMGIVYNAVHYVIMERGRVELLRQLGYTYKQLEDNGYFLAVVESGCKYKKPIPYDALVETITWVEVLKRKYIRFRYILRDSENPEVVFAEGFSAHVPINANWQSIPMPDELYQKLQSII